MGIILKQIFLRKSTAWVRTLGNRLPTVIIQDVRERKELRSNGCEKAAVGGARWEDWGEFLTAKNSETTKQKEAKPEIFCGVSWIYRIRTKRCSSIAFFKLQMRSSKKQTKIWLFPENVDRFWTNFDRFQIKKIFFKKPSNTFLFLLITIITHQKAWQIIIQRYRSFPLSPTNSVRGFQLGWASFKNTLFWWTK